MSHNRWLSTAVVLPVNDAQAAKHFGKGLFIQANSRVYSEASFPAM